MKKALTLLLAAAFSGLASAVTLNWAADNTAKLNWGTMTQLSVTITFTANDLTSVSGKVDFFSVDFNANGTGGSASSSFFVRHANPNNGNQALRLVLNGSGSSFSYADPAISAVEHTLTLVFDKENTTTGSQSVKASYQLDDGALTTIDTQTLSMSDVITLKKFDAASIGTISNVEAKLVPEPTVLALLALGVSALALRRRAA